MDEITKRRDNVKGKNGELRPGSSKNSYMYGYKKGERGSTGVRERVKLKKKQGPRNQEGGMIRVVSC